MLIQIHMLQNYAPANLNRDDTGSPKDAFFGGVRRGRISSQCLKRSIRRSQVFEEAFRTQGLLGTRTKKIPALLKEELEKIGVQGDAFQAIVERLPELGRESAKNKGEDDESPATDEEEQETEVKQLIFIAPNEVPILAQKIWDTYQKMGPAAWKKAKIKDITADLGKSLPRSVDIAMFGRMTTSGAFEDVQAAVQVAHALSVNALAQEFDYYTAVDDLSTEPGAGMIGDIEFNSSTYYKYINIHWEQLIKNLGGDLDVARRAVLALVEAAATVQPTGKQNTFAAHNLPDLVLLEVSQRNLPVSYANAFIKPVSVAGSSSLVDTATQQLADYIQKISHAYQLSFKQAFMALQPFACESAVKKETLKDLQDWLAEQLPQGA